MPLAHVSVLYIWHATVSDGCTFNCTLLLSCGSKMTDKFNIAQPGSTHA